MKRGRSIRRRLLVMLISSLVLVWLVSIALVHRVAEHEVEEVFDANLARSARVLQSLLLHEVEEEAATAANARDVAGELGSDGLARYPLLAGLLAEYQSARELELLELRQAEAGSDHPYGSGLAFVARYADGSVMLRERGSPDLPPDAIGFHDLLLGPEHWRVFGLRDPATGLRVHVGERIAFRAELVRYITRNTLLPMLFAMPVLALLVWALVGRALRPLRQVTAEVAARAPDALEPIHADSVPREIHGLLIALNTLFGRVRSAMERERRFTADAAHELRTPLAAMKTHLQVAQGRSAEPATRSSLEQVLAGVDRATHSVEQLLLLARADARAAGELMASTVDLQQVALDVVSALSQQAVDRSIDLGVEPGAAAPVRGDETAIHLLVRNLVDNAVRYTPVGSMVTVSTGIDSTGVWLRVADDGQGVPPEERERLFDRFHRGTRAPWGDRGGSGLGLSIVQRIAELHHGKVLLGEGLGGRGLGVTVRFPPSAVATSG
jgi:two-component system sensor histidine kinase QseC